MAKKKYAMLALLSLLICMVAISSASADENANADGLTEGDVAAVSVEEIVNDDNALDSDNKEITNEEVLASDNDNDDNALDSDNKEITNEEVLASDNDNDEISTDNSDEVLSSTSPAYDDYSVQFQKSSYSWSWSNGGNVNIDITPVNEPYYYDFYFKIIKNGDEISNKNIYSSNEEDRDYYNEYYYTYNFEARSSEYGIGTYTLQLINYKDGYVFDTATLKVTAAQGKLTITQAGNYATNKKLTFKLVDYSSGKAIANQRINLRFSNGVSTFVKTNSNGVATYYVKFKPGTYVVIASVPGNAVKVANKQFGNIKIAKTPVTLNPRPLVAYYASGKYFNVKVTDNARKAIGGVKLKLDIYTGSRKLTRYIKTVSTGWAKFGASTLAVGTHKVIVSVASTNLHVGKAQASRITIRKGIVNIYAPNIVNAYKQDGKYGVRIYNRDSGNPLSGWTVQIKVYTGSSAKTFKVRTNANGYASIPTNTFSKGKHTVVVNTIANSYYNAARTTGYLSIANKIPTHFDIDRSSLRYNTITLYSGGVPYATYITSVHVPVRLLDNLGHEIYKTVTLRNDDNTETGTSGETISIGGGSDITLRFAGDSKYMPCTYVLDI